MGAASKGQTPKNIKGTPGKKLSAGHKISKAESTAKYRGA